MHIFKTLVLLFLISACLSQQIVRVNRRLRIVGEQEAAIESRAESMNSLIEEMAIKLKGASLNAATADTCSSGFDKVLVSLGDLEDKIGNLEAGTEGGNNVSVYTSIIAGNTSRVLVTVEQAFKDCMDYWTFDTSNNAGNVWCLRVALWQYITPAVPVSRTKRSVAANTPTNERLDEVYIDKNDPTEPLTGFRLRKEYRNLTESERQAFHQALRVLEENGTVACFAETHARGAGGINRIHRGNAFLPFHRAFIAMFEEALRRVNKDVVLPYWDSTIEDNVERGPGISGAASSIFGRNYMGNPNGRVRSGPARGWRLSNGPLRRMVGRSSTGKTIAQTDIDDLMTRCNYRDIASRLEGMHNSVHVYIGGTMSGGRSPLDPLFYMHHAFIDKIWQDFREHQIKDCPAVDPVTDYPMDNRSRDGHRPDNIMGEMSFLKNIDGMAAYWVEASWYGYAPSPRCPHCYGNDLYCDTSLGLCKPLLRFKMKDTPASIRKTAKKHDQMSQKKHDSYGQILMNKYPHHEDPCKLYPYMSRCPKQHRVINMTLSEIASAMCSGQIPYSKYAGEIQSMLDQENAEAELDPPVNGPQFFANLPHCSSTPSNCRSPSAIVYDLLTHTERGIDLRWMK